MQILSQDFTSLFISDLISLVIIVKEMAIVRVAILIISRDIIIVGIVGLELVFLGLFPQKD